MIMDGSRTEKGTSIGIFEVISRQEHVLLVGMYAAVFQLKVTVLMKYV